MLNLVGTENPKEYLGREKDCVSKIPMCLMLKLARVHKLGADKYGQKNWRVQPIRMSTYYDAIFRHLVEWFEGGEDNDPESKEHHLHHVIACSLILLDAMDHKSIADDRGYTEVKTGSMQTKPEDKTSEDKPEDKTSEEPTTGPMPPVSGRLRSLVTAVGLEAVEAQLRAGG